MNLEKIKPPRPRWTLGQRAWWPGPHNLGHTSPRSRNPGSHNLARAAPQPRLTRPRSRGLGGLARALSLSLWSGLIWLFLSLWSGLPLSDLTLSLSLIWSDPVRWGCAWDLEFFKIFLVYKSSLKDLIFKWSPHGKWCHIRCD